MVLGSLEMSASVKNTKFTSSDKLWFRISLASTLVSFVFTWVTLISASITFHEALPDIDEDPFTVQVSGISGLACIMSLTAMIHFDESPLVGGVHRVAYTMGSIDENLSWQELKTMYNQRLYQEKCGLCNFFLWASPIGAFLYASLFLPSCTINALRVRMVMTPSPALCKWFLHLLSTASKHVPLILVLAMPSSETDSAVRNAFAPSIVMALSHNVALILRHILDCSLNAKQSSLLP